MTILGGAGVHNPSKLTLASLSGDSMAGLYTRTTVETESSFGGDSWSWSIDNEEELDDIPEPSPFPVNDEE